MYKKAKKKKKKKNKKYNILISMLIILLLYILSYIEIENFFNINVMIRDLFYGKYHTLNEIDINIALNDEASSSINELKKMLDIENILIDFVPLYASVIERNNNYYMESFVINKGSFDGIEENMAVVDNYGLVGTISKVSLYTSNVSLITSPSKYNNISVEIIGEEKVNKMLKVKNNKLVIDGINKNAKISENDKVFTNGLSNKYPSGILIGYIETLELDNNSVYKNASVKLYSNIENLKYVAVLKRSIKWL